MKTTLLIAAALVFPLIWGYLAERLLRRIWPQHQRRASVDSMRSQNKDDQPSHYIDYQI